MSAPTALTYAGNSLQTANIVTSQIDHENITAKDAKLYALAHASASKIPFVSYPSKNIIVSGYLTNSGQASWEVLADTFRGYFTGVDQNLDITYGNSTRRYVATAEDVKITRDGGLTYAEWQVTFATTKPPFGIDTFSGMLLTASGRTNATYSDSITLGGNAPWQWPTILIVYTTASGGNSVTLGNSGTGQQIAVTRVWQNNDNLLVDVRNRLVYVNGNVTTFSGAFPEFAPGAGTLTYADTFSGSSRNFAISVSNQNMWL